MAQENKITLSEEESRVFLLNLECIRFSCESLFLSHERIINLLEEVESLTTSKSNIPSIKAISIFSDAWSIVDHADRIKKLLKKLKFFSSQKIKETRIKLEKINFRNYIQHIDTRISSDGKVCKIPETSPPIMGGISWQSSKNPFIQYTILNGNEFIKSSHYGLVFDTVNRKFFKKIEFQTFEDAVDIEYLTNLIRTLYDELKTQIENLLLSNNQKYVFSPEFVAVLCADLSKFHKKYAP